MRLLTLTTLTQKLCVYIGTATCAVLLLTVEFNYEIRRRSVEQESNAVALDHIQNTAQNIDAYIDRVAMLPKGIAARQESLNGEPNATTIPFLTHLLDAVPPEDAYGVYEAFERKHYTDALAYPWVDRKSMPNSVQPKYDYHETDWYKGAKRTGNLFISEPYFDRGGSNITMVSIAKPFFDAKGDLLGVAGVDVSLELIRLFASYLRLRSGDTQGADGDYAFLVSREGKIIAHPDERLMPREDFKGADAGSLPDGKFVVAKPNGYGRFRAGNQDRRVYWATAPLSGWKVALNVPEALILQPGARLLRTTAYIAGLSLCAMLGLLVVVARRLTAPVRQITAAAEGVEAENYAATENLAAALKRRDAVGAQARAFQRMVREVAAREQRLKQAEEALRRSERHFRALIEKGRDMIAVLNADGVTVYQSASVERVLGYKPADLEGKHAVDFIHPDDPQPASHALATSLATPA